MASARVPRRGERVRVEGHPGRLVVVYVDRVRETAKVELWDDPGFVLRDVPFEEIQVIDERTREAA